MNKHNVKNIIVSAVILAYLITTQGLVYNLQNTNRGLKNDLEDTQNENVQYKSELDKLNETIQEQNNKLNDLQKTADKYAKEQEETNKISDIITNSNSSVGSDTAHIIANAIISNSAKYNLPTEELMAVIRIESNFNQYELGTQQDSGLMQLIPSTQKLIAKDMGISNYDIFNINTNIEMGAYFLSNLKNKYGKYTYIVYNQGLTKPLNDTTYTYNLNSSTSYMHKVNQYSDLFRKELM